MIKEHECLSSEDARNTRTRRRLGLSGAATALLLSAGLLGLGACGDAGEPSEDEALVEGDSTEAQAPLSAAPVCLSLRRAQGAPAGSTVRDAQLSEERSLRNYGTATVAIVGTTSGPETSEMLIAFDLSSIPAGATILSSAVVVDQTSSAPGTLHLHRALAPWSEATVTWASFGQAFDAADVAQLSTASNPAMASSAGLVQLVQGWASGAIANHGLLIEQGGLVSTKIKTSEYAVAAARPRLNVCYALPCAQGFADCNGNGADGCEADLSSVNHCGACGVSCSLANASAACAAGVCTVAACSAGFGDCDGNPQNGCEPLPCGVGSSCSSGAECASLVCVGGLCAEASCVDGVKNGGEAGPDCGGACSFDDKNACTLDTCDPAAGAIHTAVAVDDANACTLDACDPLTGVSHVPVSADDGNACTADSCDPLNGVIHVPMNVDDGNACTADSCDPSTGVVHVPVNVDDGNVCTTDACNPVTGVSHTPVDVNDGNACTNDSCDPVTGIAHTPSNAPGCYGTATAPGASCRDILVKGASSGNGVYWIALGGGAAFQVYCDMARHGGGWMLVGAIGEGATATSAFDSDLSIASLLSPVPSAGTYAHFNLSRFNGFGSTWTVRSATDVSNNQSSFQYAFFRPKSGASISPGTAGQNWNGTNTHSLLQHLTMSSTTGLANTTWIAVDSCSGGHCGFAVNLFTSRRPDLGGQCLGANGQTTNCHSVQGGVSGQGGTMTAAFGMQDGVAHTWGRKGTYWLRDTANNGTP